METLQSSEPKDNLSSCETVSPRHTDSDSNNSNFARDSTQSDEKQPSSGIKRKLDDDDQRNKAQNTEPGQSYGSVVAGHYNQLEEKGLSARNESRILYMRNFNNWIKSYFINKFVTEIKKHSQQNKLTVVDLGCGKGGDLFKWTKANIRHLVCVDIAETSVRQCKERYEFNRSKKYGAPTFSAEFIVADCTKACLQSLLHDARLEVQIVSCQFAFHYCFESLEQAEIMIKNASSNLVMGGYFILTIPDANYITKKLRNGNGRSFGNEVFHIEFPEDRPAAPPLFGDRYQFFLEGVVDCPEFLVHQATLMRLCKKYGMTCVYNQRFRDVYSEALKDSQSRVLLEKMSALEPYSSCSAPQSNSRTANPAKEYAAARDYLDGNNSLSTILTLSASEWEATNIYTALAFKKDANCSVN